jgi:uncharacterized RDD family membrane protein YckC
LTLKNSATGVTRLKIGKKKMFCQECGQQNKDAAALCVKCGAPVVAAGAAPATRTAAVGGVYAGFWKRLAACVIDYVLVLAVLTAVTASFIYGVISIAPNAGGDVGLLAGPGFWVILFLYHAVMESSPKQATLGKMALGIKVTDQSGVRISFGRATGRHFAKILSGMILAIGYYMAGFTAKKQGLHDMIAGCLVVNASATEAQVQTSAPAASMPWWAMTLIVISAMVIPVGILAAISIPAYQDFTLRTRVSDALMAGGAARSAVTEYYEQIGKWPTDLNDALKASGVTEQVSPYVRNVTLEPRTGAIRIVLAQSLFEGKSILFVPHVENKTVNWKCRSDDVPQRYLPHSCRDAAARP